MVWGALGALIFSVYLVYDTQVSDIGPKIYITIYILEYSIKILAISVHAKTSSDDDRRRPQVLDLPRGVHLRRARHLPGHHQHLYVPPQVDHHRLHHLHRHPFVSPHIDLSWHLMLNRSYMVDYFE